MSGRDGGPAFPVSTRRDEDGDYGHQDGPSTWRFPGMTLRDYFAGQALAGLIASKRHSLDFEPVADATYCYAIADAMLAARAPDPREEEDDDG